MMQSHNQLLDVPEVATLLELEEADVQWLINTKQLSARNINNTTRITMNDVRRLVNAYVFVARRRTHR